MLYNYYEMHYSAYDEDNNLKGVETFYVVTEEDYMQPKVYFDFVSNFRGFVEATYNRFGQANDPEFQGYQLPPNLKLRLTNLKFLFSSETLDERWMHLMSDEQLEESDNGLVEE